MKITSETKSLEGEVLPVCIFCRDTVGSAGYSLWILRNLLQIVNTFYMCFTDAFYV